MRSMKGRLEMPAGTFNNIAGLMISMKTLPIIALLSILPFNVHADVLSSADAKTRLLNT